MTRVQRSNLASFQPIQRRAALRGGFPLFGAALLGTCLPVWAQQASAPAVGPAPSITASVYTPTATGGGMIWLTFVTLLLLAGVVLLVAWLVHRNMTATVPNSAIKVLSVQSLGPRERVVIASVVGRIYVLGHTASQINLIAELEPEEVMGLIQSPAPTDFAARLSEILRRVK
jgi:flagellar protein FliO/FliZ